MQTFVRAVVVTAAAVAVAAGTAGIASAQPAPPQPQPTPADERAQLACVQQYLDLTTAPQQAVQDPVAFSLRAADAAQKCKDVRAPVPAPAVPAPAV